MTTQANGRHTYPANEAAARPVDLTVLLRAVAMELSHLAATTQTIQHALGQFLESGGLPGPTEATSLQELDRLHQIQADLGSLLEAIAIRVTHTPRMSEAELRKSMHLRELHERLGLSDIPGSAAQAKGEFDLF
ncbi:MAG: hypothetical protein AAF667_04040 [Pseudomonadota bacterium]